jgi:glycerol-3-phosphate dehydrogenase
MDRSIPTDTPFDLIIIGGGINGAGIARDAAMRGLRVLLLEKGDLGSGTTSWSSRLIHGGLRYLEYGELGLVRESLRERETLLKIVPHLVRPLPMLLPIYQQSNRGLLTVRAGMIAYDLLSIGKSLPRHRMLSADEALKLAPGLSRDGLKGAALYYDAQVEFPERLVVENALAARKHGATIMTYARVDRLIHQDDSVAGVEFTDLMTNERHEARGSVTINVAGPWVDQVLAGERGSEAPLIGGTKGSHLIVEKFDGAPEAALYVEALEDGRPFFIIPWNGRFLIGTTDIQFDGDLDRVEATEQEIEYLLNETNRVVSSAKLTRESILYTYAGVRPLPFVDSANSSGITRQHFIRQHARLKNFISIVGGKLTTYRSLSEEAVDHVFKKLGRAVPRCSSAETMLPGAEHILGGSQITHERRNPELSDRSVERLFRIYGLRVVEIVKLVEGDPKLKDVFDQETDAIAAEIVFAFNFEMAQTLIDCLFRRTMVGLNASAGLNAVDAAARIAQTHLNWSEARMAKEIEAYREYVRRFHPTA